MGEVWVGTAPWTDKTPVRIGLVPARCPAASAAPLRQPLPGRGGGRDLLRLIRRSGRLGYGRSGHSRVSPFDAKAFSLLTYHPCGLRPFPTTRSS